MKTCIRCKVEKTLDEFHRSSRAKDGRVGVCKVCRKLEYKKPERTPEENMRFRLWTRYRITPEIYYRLLGEQNHGCAICGTKVDVAERNLAVDHCHKTGRVRGLLCMACNTGIGRLKDDPVLVAKALEYLTDAEGH